MKFLFFEFYTQSDVRKILDELQDIKIKNAHLLNDYGSLEIENEQLRQDIVRLRNKNKKRPMIPRRKINNDQE